MSIWWSWFEKVNKYFSIVWQKFFFIKRGGRTKVVCGFCMTPVCHQHVYEGTLNYHDHLSSDVLVCPSCIDDKRPPGKVRPFTSPAKEKFPIKNTSSPQVSQFLQAPVRQPPPLILMQSQFPNVAALNFQAQLPRSSFILPKQSDGKCPIRKINWFRFKLSKLDSVSFF